MIENVSPFGTQAPTPTLQKKVALAVGRLSNQKGFDRLIALWRGVAAQAPDWRLLIIGDGPSATHCGGRLKTPGWSGR